MGPNNKVTEDDLIMNFEYNRLLREDLEKQLKERPYQELVRAFPTEFSIERRYMLSGSRWVKAPEPTEEDALGPNPPMDYKLDGLKWWYNQGFGGEIDAQIWKTICSEHYPTDPFAQYIGNWISQLPSTTDDYASVDARSVSTISAATSFEERVSVNSYVHCYGYNTWEEFMASYEWYPESTDEEGSDGTIRKTNPDFTPRTSLRS
ncbi:hypothetical protein F5Y06DRAFT_301364 [Hypoxylon sp. FL0890]|nr:hypothetical protein F5Y06DRAFT_301364 [Hypoxylon sp. FL0890]